MAIKINFDVTNTPEEPTLILAKKNGDKLGKINARSIQISSSLNEADEITFDVYKYADEEKDPLWDLIANFKLVHCPEMGNPENGEWFEITVETDESNELKKIVYATELGHAELGQLMLYNIAINTEGEDGDIARDDYVIPTVLYRANGYDEEYAKENGLKEYGITESDKKFYKEVKKEDMPIPFDGYKDASLLHRILKDKAPHYSVAYVDPRIKHIQRVFEFDDTSIYDALTEIAEEINCIFAFDAGFDDDGIFKRTISVYDLESYCNSCGYRGEFSDVCPECNGKDIDHGYGEDTTIFVTSDEIANDIQLTTNADEIKNCFKLEAGDEGMTADIKAINPNGSDYIWYIPDEMKADMSIELQELIKAYDEEHALYQTGNIIDIFNAKADKAKEEGDEVLYGKYSKLIDDYDSLIKLLGKPDAVNEDGELHYNGLVNKYNYLRLKDDKFETIDYPFIGFSSLINALYNSTDMYGFLTSSLMPSVTLEKPKIEEEAAKLVLENMSPVAVNVASTHNTPAKILSGASISTVDGIVKEMAKTLVDSRYDVSIKKDSSSLWFYGKDDGALYQDIQENKSKYEEGTSEKSYKYWQGTIVVSLPKRELEELEDKSLGEKEVSFTKDNMIKVNADYETYARFRMDKALAATDSEDMSISGLFKKNLIEDLVESTPVLVEEVLDDNGNRVYEYEAKHVNELPESAEVGDMYECNGDIYVWCEGEFKSGETVENSFEYALKEYSLSRLESFQAACMSCINILQEIGVASGNTWGNVRKCNACGHYGATKNTCPECGVENQFITECPELECDYVGMSHNECANCGSTDIDYSLDLYMTMYAQYMKKHAAIEHEMSIRDAEIALIEGVLDANKDIASNGVWTLIESIKAGINDDLDFKKFIGDKLWLEFSSFRREDKYSNDNYISDGKTNAERIDLARQFIETANKEIYKSAELQCSISAGLKNLLVINKFKPIVDKFEVGNWLRVMIDEKIYKLRLVKYEIDYEKLDDISVEFSDTVKANSSIKSVQGILAQASSMATSYSSVQRQAKRGEESKSTISGWIDSGLDTTNVKIVGGADGQSQTWDSNGMLFREYDSVTGEYSPEQMKIINSTMAITTDNWDTTKTAVGKYYYKDQNGDMKMAYGVNAETIIGKFILGENMTISNQSGSMVFDDNGFVIEQSENNILSFNDDGLVAKNNDHKVSINPSSESIISIEKIAKTENNENESVFSVEANGDLNIVGNITANSLELGEGVKINANKNIDNLSLIALNGSYTNLIGDSDKSGQVLSLNDNNGVTATLLADVATSGDYEDLTGKPTIPTVPDTATSVSSTEANPVSGKAVYDYAVAKNQGVSNAGKLLYVNNDGSVTTLSIEGLKELLKE